MVKSLQKKKKKWYSERQRRKGGIEGLGREERDGRRDEERRCTLIILRNFIRDCAPSWNIPHAPDVCSLATCTVSFPSRRTPAHAVAESFGITPCVGMEWRRGLWTPSEQSQVGRPA